MQGNFSIFRYLLPGTSLVFSKTMSQLLLIYTMTYFRIISRSFKNIIKQITYFLAPMYCFVLAQRSCYVILILSTL